MSELNALNIAVAGLGTVGVGVIKILTENSDVITARSETKICVTAVSARDKHRDRGIDISGIGWEDNSVDLAARSDVDAVIELIGGSEGPALALARATLSRGKAFITANKALIAHHGKELAVLAAQNNTELRFEAAVAGGIPIIKALREGLAANEITGVYGILNGTCNYILTRMEEEGLSFEAVLTDAQRLGYAEADPTFDVDGIDTGHKTTILASIAYGVEPSMENLTCEGIRSVTGLDIHYAAELGYRIKLLGITKRVADHVQTSVYPAMVPLDSALAAIGGATNAVVVDGSYVGQTVYVGAGAGEGPTASAVVADIIDVVRGNGGPALGIDAATLLPATCSDSAQIFSAAPTAYYIRLRVKDQPGVMADISSTLARADVSLDSIYQHDHAQQGGVYVILATHETLEEAITGALATLEGLDCVLEGPAVIRIEAL